MEKNVDGMTVQQRKAVDKHRNGKFGYLCCSPSCLQWLNSPWVFLTMIILAMVGNTAAVLGTLATVLPHIEKRFNLSSFDSGMIAASNDVPAVIFGLFVAHWGHFGNKVRWIGVGGIITGIGLFICTIPHYLIGKYEPALPQNILCGPPPGFAPPMNVTGNNTGGGIPPSGCDDEGEIAERYHLAIILIGQFIAGMGTIPLFAFPPAIFRETVKERYLPMCLAFWQVSVFLGPLIAFSYSETLLETWVDITEPSQNLMLTPQDPRWISAWWVGFLGPAGLCFLVGLVILGMPEHIKSYLNDTELDEIKRIDEKNAEKTLKEKLFEIPEMLWALLTNWTYVFNSLAFNSTLMFVEGLTPFIAKILILRYGVEIQDVGKTLNVAIVPPLVVGIAFSLILLRVLKIENSGKKSAFICFLLHLSAIFPPMASLVEGCKNVNLAGHSVPYGVRIAGPDGFHLNETFPDIPDYPLGSTCNANCSCGLNQLVPMCGSDGVTYLTPCFAGCRIPTPHTFLNCSCISTPDGYGGTGKIGFCEADCKNWLPFLVLISLFSLATFAQLAPSKIVVMRVVDPKHLSFAFALHYLSNKILANIPGPILFGHVVDLSCDIWQKVCDKTGFCMIYDMDHMMNQLAIVTGSLTGIGLVCYCISWLVYKEFESVGVAKREFEINNEGYQADMEKNGHDTKI